MIFYLALRCLKLSLCKCPNIKSVDSFFGNLTICYRVWTDETYNIHTYLHRRKTVALRIYVPIYAVSVKYCRFKKKKSLKTLSKLINE